MKNNKLYSEIEKLNDRYKDSSYVDVNKELYQLTEDVACHFAVWFKLNVYSLKLEQKVIFKINNLSKEFQETKDVMNYFIENIYKKEK